MDLLNSTLGAVGAAGDAIDKFTGGRAVRGVLGGKGREALSFLPFSDTLGLTNEADKTSGRDLTDHYGITRKGDTSFGSHAAGFFADNILSPGNWLGAAGAIKAAPTISKGFTQGAKALTGLDLIDHVRSGARGLGKLAKKAFKDVPDGRGGFINVPWFTNADAARETANGFRGDNLLSGDSGAAKIPPLPIDVHNFNETHLAANVTRPRRFSTDPARKDWYAGDRQYRFGQRFGSTAPKERVPSGIPEFNLSDAVKNFIGDESGAIHLPTHGETLRFKQGGDADEGLRHLVSNVPGEAKGRRIGHTAAPDGQIYDQLTAARMFPDVVDPSKPVQRINGIRLNSSYRGLGIGQTQYLDMLNQHPDSWHYNSQAYEPAVNALNALKKKGLADVHWKGGEGGVHVVKTTPEGTATLMQRLKQFMGDESGALKIGGGNPKPMSMDEMWSQATPKSNLVSATTQPFEPSLKYADAFLKEHKVAGKPLSDLDIPSLMDAARDYFGDPHYKQYVKHFGWDQIQPKSFEPDYAKLTDFLHKSGYAGKDLHTVDGPTLMSAVKAHFGSEADDYAKLQGWDKMPPLSEHWDDADFQLDDSPLLSSTPKVKTPDEMTHDEYWASIKQDAKNAESNDDFHFGSSGFTPPPGSLLDEIMSGKHLVDPSGGDPWDKFVNRPKSAILSEPDAARKKVNKAINGIGNKFGDDTDTRGLAEAFIKRPDLDAASDPMAVADKFHDAMEDGKKGANSYFSSLYYDINDHLRKTGAEKLPEEIARIRSAVPSARLSQTPVPLDENQQAMLGQFYKKYAYSPEGLKISGDLSKSVASEHLGEFFGEDAARYKPHVLGDYVDDRTQRVDGAIKNLMTLIDHSRMPANMDLFRGIDGPGVKKIEQILGVKLNSPEAIGKEFTDPGFLSTAYEKSTANSFSGLEPGYNRPDSGAVFHFPDVPAGKPASFMNSTENEILFPPGRKIRIDDNSEYPNRIKATLYSAIMAAMAGRMARNAQGD